ncbi:MAG TPA: ribosome biogenesis GTPase Der [Actinomycetota bacterium]|nr:ribosome biogenesis GTPase Der [Actinomycetota bacterium]
MAEGIPVVAVVGRPNVGKSSLVNRILGRREAIVEATPGVTRDRHSFVAEWAGKRFELVDTGGLEAGQEGLDARVAEQAQVAIELADVIVFVVDSASGPIEDDHLVARALRKSDKPVLLVANKADDPRDEPSSAAFYRLGLGEPHPLSALHGRGSGDFLEALVAELPEATGPEHDEWASIAIIGRPNVGKSSLLNALTRSERSIVDSTPGTTRDPVDSVLELADGRRLRIVDTAGMRREVKVKDPIEYFGWLRSRRTLNRVDCAILMLDADEGVTGPDQRIAEAIVEAGRACVLVLNKWDIVRAEVELGPDRDRLERDISTKLRWLDWATPVRVSALTKRGIDRILPAAVEAIESHRRRLQTSEVNRIVVDAQLRSPHPRVGGRPLRVRYAVQAEVAPPTIVLFTNGRLETNYLRYLENQIRETEPFQGSPLKLTVRIRTREPAGSDSA